jgi:hypothetical protein
LDSNSQAILLPELPAPKLVAQEEFSPLADFQSFVPKWLRDTQPDPVQLETRGTTSHLDQQELWGKNLILKESVIAKLMAIGCVDLAKPLKECHTYQGFAQCGGCNKVKPFWNRCEVFYCPVCQPTLARDRAQSIAWWVTEIDQPKHVVLTVRNTAHLTQQYVRWFKASFAKLRRRKITRNWAGGLYSLEVTNEDKGWHLHLHALVNAYYIDKAELARTWAEIVGQDFAIVGIYDARQRDYTKEVCKYAVKGTELSRWSPMQIATFIDAFKGVRTFGVFGTLYGLRTKYRDWINQLRVERRKCDCGCNDWHVYDEAAWTWKQLQAQPQLRPMPPPVIDLELPLVFATVYA